VKFFTMACPTEPSSSLAPMMATLLGLKILLRFKVTIGG
jgi:hypothetical protein